MTIIEKVKIWSEAINVTSKTSVSYGFKVLIAVNLAKSLGFKCLVEGDVFELYRRNKYNGEICGKKLTSINV